MKPTTIKTLTALPLAGAIALAGSAAVAETYKLTVASGYAPVITALRVMDTHFFPVVAAELEGSEHAIEWTMAVSGTLAKAPDVLEAVETGLADVGHVVTVVEGAKLPLQNVGYYAVFGTSDPGAAAEIQHAMQGQEIMAAEWASVNQVYLANYPLDTYQLFSTEPIESVADIEGLKVGGGGANLPWVQETGAAGVATTGARAYNDLKTGLIDAVLAPATLGNTANFAEVAPYMSDINFGAVSIGALTVNQSAWDALPAEVQAALRAGSESWRLEMIAETQRAVGAAIDNMTEAGLTVIEVSDDARSAWAEAIPNPAEAWATDAGRLDILRQYMDELRATGVVFPRDWDAL